MAKTTIYFSERKVSDQEIWQYIVENSTGDTSDFIKYLIRKGMDTMNSSRTKTSLHSQANHARLKRQNKTDLESTESSSNTAKELKESSSNTVQEPTEISARTVLEPTESSARTVPELTESSARTVPEPMGGLKNAQEEGNFDLGVTEEKGSHESDPFFQTETDPEILRLFNR